MNPPYTNTCPTCGNEYSSVKGMKQHHARTHGESLSKQEYTCPVCDEDFVKRRSNSKGEKTFCSRECHQEHTRKTGIGDMSLSGEHVECETCGEEIYRHPYQLEEDDRHFCSRECKNKGIQGDGHHYWNGGKTTVECTVCGSDLERYPKQAEKYDRHFCYEKGCRYEWISENHSGEQHPSWKGGKKPYLGSWQRQRTKALERDGYECRACGMDNETHNEVYGKNLHVHHVVPLRNFDDPEDANSLGNLVTTCKDCHVKYEGLPVFPN